MAAQFDFIAGVDISSLSSVTQAQLMQMINQIAPLSNIGGVIVQAGTSTNPHFNEGDGGSPSVTDNPRFARYIWLNTHDAATAAPTPYYYDASMSRWSATNIAAESITDAEIAPGAEIAVTKLAKGLTKQLIRTNQAATAVEYVNPNQIFTNGDLPVASLTPALTYNSYLKTSPSGAVSWSSFTDEKTAFQSAISALQVTQLSAGAPLSILRTNGSGAIAWDLPSAAFGSGSNIPLSALAAAGVPNNFVLFSPGNGAWTAARVSLGVINSPSIGLNGSIPAFAADGTAITPLDDGLIYDTYRVEHGLGSGLVSPKLVRVVLVCVRNDTSGKDPSFIAGAEIPIECITSTTGAPTFSVVTNSTYVYIAAIAKTSTSFNIIKPTSPAATRVALTPANWCPKVYVYA
jgi:hypothetical protein